jgi:hypothetical protein
LFVPEQEGSVEAVAEPVPENVLPPTTPPSSSWLAFGKKGSRSSAKPKLPHGLTVHELKEMTKARLEAEAAQDGVTLNEGFNAESHFLAPVADPYQGYHEPFQSPTHLQYHEGFAANAHDAEPLYSTPTFGSNGWPSQPSNSDTWESASASSPAFLTSSVSSGLSAAHSVGGDDLIRNPSSSGRSCISPLFEESFNGGYLPSRERSNTNSSPLSNLPEHCEVGLTLPPMMMMGGDLLRDTNRSRAWTETAIPTLSSPSNTLLSSFVNKEPVTGLVVDTFRADPGTEFPGALHNLSSPLLFDTRGRASTWSPDLHDHSLSLFGNRHTPDDLSEDLVSILKLSGLEDKSESDVPNYLDITTNL